MRWTPDIGLGLGLGLGAHVELHAVRDQRLNIQVRPNPEP